MKNLLVLISSLAFLLANPTKGNSQYMATSESGITYRVQIMATNKPVDETYFSLSRNINLYVKQENAGDIIRYTVGNASNYEEATHLCNEMQKRGVKGAFVVAYNSGVRVTHQQATMLASQQSPQR